MSGGVKRLWREAMVVARRDFLAVVATPTFLLFLLAPLFMLGMGMVGGIGASGLADSAASKDRMVIIADTARQGQIRAAEKRLRALDGHADGPNSMAPLEIFVPEADTQAQAKRLIAQTQKDTIALAYGPMAKPIIMEVNEGGRSGRFLAALAEQSLRDSELTRADALRSAPEFRAIVAQKPSNSGRQALGFAGVFGVFLLSLMLASQTVGMMAEEKSNKVLEILAASIPLEAVFFGKLVGMFGVSILFVAFWATLAMGGGSALSGMMGADAAGGVAGSLALSPAIGWPMFFILGFAYFTMAFMLLGSMFLAIGALAATIREIQMLSLPITILQVAMFSWASLAANAPTSMIATTAQIFPFSSPFAMAARGATDAAIWPHIAALAWQGLWVTIVIWVGVRLFRIGVLKSNVGWKFWKKDGPVQAG
jgi:ABC-2 type transport system permease protein